jgi:hypothetical protein
LAPLKYFEVVLNFEQMKRVLQVVRAVFVFEFVTLEQFVDLLSFIDRPLETNEDLWAYFRGKTVGNLSFAVTNVVVGSEAEIKSSYYFVELCFSGYIVLIIVESRSCQMFLLLHLLILVNIVHLHLDLGRMLSSCFPFLLPFGSGLSVWL